MTSRRVRIQSWQAALTPSRIRAIRDGLSLAGIGLLIVTFGSPGTIGYDAFAYWRAANGELYAVDEGFGAFHYAPPFVWLFAPLAWIPWPAFYGAWLALEVASLVWLARRWSLAALALVPVASELYHGNVHLLLAAAIVPGFRYPALWALPILAKITPGVGLLWFVVRREWGALGIALGVTGAIAGVSLLLDSTAWQAWVAHLPVASSGAPANAINIPVAVRLPIAAAIVVWGARTDRPWTVPVAATIALPILWIHGLSMLVAAIVLAIRPSWARASGGSPAVSVG